CRFPLASRPSIQQSSRLTYWYPTACMPLETKVSAICLMSVSFKLHWNVFHEFHPIGGVAPRMPALPAAPAVPPVPPVAAPPVPVAPPFPLAPPVPFVPPVPPVLPEWPPVTALPPPPWLPPVPRLPPSPVDPPDALFPPEPVLPAPAEDPPVPSEPAELLAQARPPTSRRVRRERGRISRCIAGQLLSPRASGSALARNEANVVRLLRPTVGRLPDL